MSDGIRDRLPFAKGGVKLNRTCSIEGCDRKHSARGWCNLHYQRWLAKGDPLAEVRQAPTSSTCAFEGCETRRPYGMRWCHQHYMQQYRNGELGLAKGPTPYRNPTGICEIEGCEKTARGRHCSMHAARISRHGDPATVLDPPKLTGSANPVWVGDQVEYSAAHDRVRRQRGRASDYVCAHGCGRQARDWAYDHQDPVELVRERDGCTYSPDPDHYIPLCVSCHRKFDGAAANLRPEARRLAQPIRSTLRTTLRAREEVGGTNDQRQGHERHDHLRWPGYRDRA